MKVPNLSEKPITLKRNYKHAGVSPCLAVEDFEVFQGTTQLEKDKQETAHDNAKPTGLKLQLHQVGSLTLISAMPVKQEKRSWLNCLTSTMTSSPNTL